MYLLVVPWTQRAYVCIVDTARVNQLPNLESQYSQLYAKFSGIDATLPSSVIFETRVETDPAAARRAVQRWITSANHQERRQDTAASSSAPVIILLHSSSATTTTTTSTCIDAPWSIGEQIVGRRRSPQLTALAEVPVVPLGGTGDDTGVEEEGGDAADAYSILNWQRTVAKRGIKFFLQVCTVSKCSSLVPPHLQKQLNIWSLLV